MAPSIKKKGIARPNTTMSTKVKAKKRSTSDDDSDDIHANGRRGQGRSRQGRAGIGSGDESMEESTGNAAHNKVKQKKKSSREDSDDDDNGSSASSLSSTPILALKRAKEAKQKGNKPKATAKTTTAKVDNGKTRKRNKTASTTTKAATKQAKKTQGSTRKMTAVNSTTKSSAMAKGRKIDDSNDKKKRAAATGKASIKGNTKENLSESDNSASTSSEEEEVACCLCFCGVDCSDRALFFPKDRKQELEEDEDYYFSMDDPYLDEKLYDRNNALVYCDSCNRLYHQKCHFVPLLVVPRGDWNCLICSIQQQQKSTKTTTPKSTENNKKRKRSSGKAKSVEKKKDPEMPIHDKAEWKKFLNRKNTDQLFQTPARREELVANDSRGQVDFLSLQKEWELASAIYKAQMWHRQLKQLKTFLSSQASNIRMANTALTTMTSTKRNRQHFSGKGTKSQELAQTIVRQTGARFKIRDALLSLERLRTRDEPVHFSCLMPWCQEHPEHASHVFPFGEKLWQEERRIIPRTKERDLAKLKGDLDDDGVAINKTDTETSIPSEIHLTKAKKKMSPKSKKETAKRGNPNSSDSKKKKKTTNAKAKKDDDNADDDSGISLDELQCCVCIVGDSTDENDVLLCDGENCHRAFHMKCVYPALTMEELEDEDADWFCPLCSGVSNLMGEMHDLCVGSEDADYDADNESLESWENVQDIFPTSLWEYETAMKLLKGKRNGDTQRLLALYLGEDIEDKPEQMPIGSDSEDENDYSLFDEDSFEERKRKDREDENESDDESSRSSQATLEEMSSVEYNVDKDELAALGEDGDSNDSDEDSEDDSAEDSSTGRVRKSRRLQKRTQGEDGDSGSGDFGADFSESNIIEGKRQRKRVDYRKLNDALFGDLDDKQKSQIDDKDDFEMKVAKKKEEEDDDDDDSGSDSDDSNESSSDEEGNSNSEEGSQDEDEEESGSES